MLTDEQIASLWDESDIGPEASVCKRFARAIEAEVRKGYEKEIQRLKELLELNQIKYTEPQIAALLKKGE